MTTTASPKVIDVVAYDTGSRNHLLPTELQAMRPVNFHHKYLKNGMNIYHAYKREIENQYEIRRKNAGLPKKLRPSCIERFVENKIDAILKANPDTVLGPNEAVKILKELQDFTDPLGPLPKGYFYGPRGRKLKIQTNPNFIAEFKKHNVKYDCRAEEGERYINLDTNCIFKIMRIEGGRICFKVTEGELPGEHMTIEQFNSMNLRKYGDPIRSEIDPKTAEKLGIMTYERYHDEISTEW